LYRYFFAAILAATGAAFAQQPELGQLDASPTLFTVMAAANAAGYDAMIDSPSNSPLRKRVRDSLAKMNIPSLPALKNFFGKHNDISPYISFALTCEGPPSFAIRKHDIEVPPDVTQVAQLTPLLAAFYKEAHIADLWQGAQPEISQALARYQKPVIDAVMQVNLYLRQQTSGASRTRFQILVELLGAPNQVHTRSYGFQYTIVLTPSPDTHVFEIRHAYLHYSLDPLATHHADILERKKGLADHAFRAQALDDRLKNDWLGLAGESLVKAVEARLDRNPAEVQKALRQGMVLAPYFSENLPAYEKQDLAMSEYYKDMVQAIDVVKEDQRLMQVKFDMQRESERTVQLAAPPPPALTGVAKTLEDAENLYAARDLDKAKETYLAVLQQTDLKKMHAAAYYGLARIAALQKDPESSQRLFLRTLELDPEPPVKAWTLVYLGKLSLASNEPDEAVKYFQQALQVEGASEAGIAEAKRSLQQISKQ
jgi:predicted negative regulator of RcsB-dependent stress response